MARERVDVRCGWCARLIPAERTARRGPPTRYCGDSCGRAARRHPELTGRSLKAQIEAIRRSLDDGEGTEDPG